MKITTHNYKQHDPGAIIDALNGNTGSLIVEGAKGLIEITKYLIGGLIAKRTKLRNEVEGLKQLMQQVIDINEKQQQEIEYLKSKLP